MSHFTVAAERMVEAPIDTVWSMVADARGYSSWARLGVSELEREGDETPDGVGAIRNFGSAGVVSREEVVAFDPPTHLGYVLLAGLPIRNYRADVRLTATSARRCRVTWSGEFDAAPAIGFVMRPFLGFVLGDFVRRLAKEAPKRA